MREEESVVHVRFWYCDQSEGGVELESDYCVCCYAGGGCVNHAVVTG